MRKGWAPKKKRVAKKVGEVLCNKLPFKINPPGGERFVAQERISSRNQSSKKRESPWR